MRLPQYLRSLNRAVTTADFEYLANEAARGRIGRVHCLQPPATSNGEIKLLIIPSVPRLHDFIAPESLYLPAELKDQVVRYLNERRLLSTRLDVMSPVFHWVETNVQISVRRGVNFDVLRQTVEARLFAFLNPLTGGSDGQGWEFGRDLFESDVMAVVLAIDGVESVRSAEIYPVTQDESGFSRGEAVDSIPVVTHGVVASYRHNVHQY